MSTTHKFNNSVCLTKKTSTALKNYQPSQKINDTIFEPVWQKIASIISKKLSPNIIAFTRFIILIAQIISLTCFSPNFELNSRIPNSVWYFCSISQFLSWIFNRIAGVHAINLDNENIQEINALTEFINHSLDSWGFVAIIMGIFSAIGVGNETWFTKENEFTQLDFICVVWICLFVKYLQSFQPVSTIHDLFELFLCLFYCAFGIFGTHFLKNQIVLNSFKIFMLVILYFIALLRANTWINKFKSFETSAAEQRENIVIVFFPLLFSFTLTTLWFLSCNFTGNYRVVLLICGTLFGNISSRLKILIMSRKNHQPLWGNEHSFYWNYLVWFVVTGFMSDGFFRFYKYTIEKNLDNGDASIKFSLFAWYAVAGLLTIGHLAYLVDVTMNLSKELKINVFSTKNQSEDSSNSVDIIFKI